MTQKLTATELQSIVDNSPLGVIIINNNGMISWSNRNMCNILHCDESELIDKSIETIDPNLSGLFTDGSTLHLNATPKHDDIWLINVAHQVTDIPDMGTIHYLSDVSSLHSLALRHEDLKSDFEDVNVTDPITGLPNRRAMYQTLEPQVSRSRRYDNPLSIIIMKLHDLTSVESNYGEPATNKMMVEISQMLNDQLRWADTIGKLEDDEFIFVLPETDSEASKNLISKVEDRLSDITLEDKNLPNIIKTRFGYASWEKGDDVGLLMRRARERMVS
ncbi:MAG: diguanylate cyclase domain-containing protein [Gammaproteobacteria bacterium]